MIIFSYREFSNSLAACSTAIVLSANITGLGIVQECFCNLLDDFFALFINWGQGVYCIFVPYCGRIWEYG